jgi:hypothetical protein
MTKRLCAQCKAVERNRKSAYCAACAHARHVARRGPLLCRSCRKAEQLPKGSGTYFCRECFDERARTKAARSLEYHANWRAKNREKANSYTRAYREKPKYQNNKAAIQRKYEYGIQQHEFMALVLQQNKACAICSEVCQVDEGPPHLRICVDHNHATGKVRALLCRKCNLAIGALRDSPQLAEKAAAYLRSHGH